MTSSVNMTASNYTVDQHKLYILVCASKRDDRCRRIRC